MSRVSFKMGTLWYIILLMVLASAKSQNVGRDRSLAITYFPEYDLDGKGEITNAFKIPCKVAGKNVKITWKKFRLDADSDPVKEFSRKSCKACFVTVESDGALVGHHMRIYQEDSGYYQCFANNSRGTVFSRKLRLRVTGANDFINRNNIDLGTKNIGDIVTLICPSSNKTNFGFVRSWGNLDQSTGRFHWLGLSKHRIIKSSDGQLTFSPLMKEDCKFIRNNGFLNCRVDGGNRHYVSGNMKLNCSNTTNNVLNVSPDWIQKLELFIAAPEGKELRLFCAASGIPSPDVSWRFNNTTEVVGTEGYKLSKSNFNRLLIIKSVNKTKHEGTYTCTAYNSEGSLTSTTVLTVQVRPKLLKAVPKQLKIKVRGNGSLSCEATGVPSPAFFWWKNGQKLSTGKRLVISDNTIKFMRADFKDTGIYQCVAENAAGMIVTSTLVTITDGSPPTIISFKVYSMEVLPWFFTTFRIRCEAAPKDVEFTWKQFKLDNRTALVKEIHETVKIDRFNYMEVGEDRTRFNVLYLPFSVSGYYQCFVRNLGGTAFSRKFKLELPDTHFDSRKQFVVTKSIGDIVSINCLDPQLTDYGFTFRWWNERRLIPRKNRIVRFNNRTCLGWKS